MELITFTLLITKVMRNFTYLLLEQESYKKSHVKKMDVLVFLYFSYFTLAHTLVTSLTCESDDHINATLYHRMHLL